MLELSICIIGIYVCFLSWGVLQERVTTKPYFHPGESKPLKFKYFIFLNFTQSVFAFLVAFIYTRIVKSSAFGTVGTNLALRYLMVALLSTLASPFGYESLKHLDYPTMILAKSCKLIPVMIMSFVLYRKTYSLVQYFSVFLITAGVFVFTFNHSEPGKAPKESRSNSLYGLMLLFINLLIDGVTNSTQDNITKNYGGTSTQMMFFMNFFSALLMAFYMTLLKPIIDLVSSDQLDYSVSNEFLGAIRFFQLFPEALVDVVFFGLAGAVGQVFIFYVLNRFGSRILVTVNVTRKMMTMIISVFWFGHVLNWQQWCAVALVFIAILGETYFGKQKPTEKPSAKALSHSESVDLASEESTKKKD